MSWLGSIRRGLFKSGNQFPVALNKFIQNNSRECFSQTATVAPVATVARYHPIPFHGKQLAEHLKAFKVGLYLLQQYVGSTAITKFTASSTSYSRIAV